MQQINASMSCSSRPCAYNTQQLVATTVGCALELLVGANTMPQRFPCTCCVLRPHTMMYLCRRASPLCARVPFPGSSAPHRLSPKHPVSLVHPQIFLTLRRPLAQLPPRADVVALSESHTRLAWSLLVCCGRQRFDRQTPLAQLPVLACLLLLPLSILLAHTKAAADATACRLGRRRHRISTAVATGTPVPSPT